VSRPFAGLEKGILRPEDHDYALLSARHRHETLEFSPAEGE
jgi:hypothetical protein